MGPQSSYYENLLQGLEDMSLDDIWPLPETSTTLKITFLLLLLYTLYYLSCVVNKPQLVGGEKGLKKHLVNHCPSLTERYWPTVWAFHYHFTTILRALLQTCPTSIVKYTREILTLSDEDELALDWASLQSDSSPPLDDTIPVLLIIPGIIGASYHNYIMHLAYGGIQAGYRPVVLNQRGMIDGLKTSRTYSAGDIRDLTEIIERIQQCYPETPIVGLGVSLGGMILTQYLHKLGEKSKLNAVISISMIWDPFQSQLSLESKMGNRMIYIRLISRKLRSIIKKRVETLTPEELEQLPFSHEAAMTATTVSEFDRHVTVPTFGYSNLEEYYTDSRNTDKMHKICKPFICITAADDPFVPKESVPVSEFSANPNTLLIMTSHGGHFGFLEGFSPNKLTWMDRISRQVLSALKHFKQT